MADGISLTLSEAGYVVGQSSAAINRAIDRGAIRAELQQRGKGSLRKLGQAELRYLAIADRVGKDLTPAGRKKVYEAVRNLPADIKRFHLGILELKLAEVDKGIAERLDRLARIKSYVDESGNEPTLHGTTVPVYAIAALGRGQSVADLLEDYPRLTRLQIEAALEYAQVYPRTGRPLPTRSFKRVLGDLAAAGVWDLEGDIGLLEPRPIP